MTKRAANLLTLFILPIALLLVGQNVLAIEKKPVKIPVFEVPTSGTIMDVQYHPEFDEWWVKCREGNEIAIYSYDKLSRKWGRVLFTPKKPGETAKRSEGARETETGDLSSETAAGASKEDKKQDSGKIEGAKKEADADQKKGDKKWWDPLNIIKGGERLIRPASPTDSK
jgi:hypothetical protein